MKRDTAYTLGFWAIILVVFVTAIYALAVYGKASKPNYQARIERNRLAAEAVAKGPTSREWPLKNGTLTEITIPYLLLGVLPETRTCYVWQNEFTKAAAMSCDYDKASPGMMEQPDNGIER